MAKIVKSDDVPSRLPDLQGLDVRDLHEEARRIVESAKARADAMMAEAKRVAEELRIAAREEGRKAGLAQGRTEGVEQGRKEGREQAARQVSERTATTALAIEAALRALEDAKRAMERDAHAELLALALQIAAKVVGAAAGDPEVVRLSVTRAVELACTRIGVVVRLHPRDLDAVRDFLPELHRRFADLEPVQIVADESVGPGGCVVTTREGSVDATLATQMEEIGRLLAGEHASEGPR